MKACYVLVRFPVLSETFVRDEIDALREAGHEVVTVSVEGGAGADIALGPVRARSGWVLRRVASLLLHRPESTARALALPRLSPGLRLKLLAAAEEARRAGVDTVHAHFAYRNADAAEVIGTALGTGHSLTAHAHDIFVERSQLGRRLAAARRVVTVCRYNRDHLVEAFPGVEEKITVIPCSTRVSDAGAGTDGIPGAGRDRSSGAEGEERLILAVGRLVEKKGFDDLIVALSLTEQPCSVAIIGDGPGGPDLAGLAERAGVSDRVRMLGALDHQATLAWYRRADVFCLPCKIAADGDRDSMPVVVKEAMAAGLPVVSTRAVGVPEMVVHRRSGLLVPPADRPALARALDGLLADRGQRQAMGEEGRRLVAERFDLRDQARAVAGAIGPGTGARVATG